MVKDPPIQHVRTAEVYSAPIFTAPPENARNEAEATRLYWKNSVLESTKGPRAYKSLLDGTAPTPPCAITSRNTGCRDAKRQRN